MKTKITYIGNCPRCGKVQESTEESAVDVDCWGCSVNANLERHDIMKDIQNAIKTSDIQEVAGLLKALEIVKKYDH